MCKTSRHHLVYNRHIPPPYVPTSTTFTINCPNCRSIPNITVYIHIDIDIDGDNQPNTDKKQATVSIQGTLEMIPESSVLEDDNSIAPENITAPQSQHKTDWPDAPAIQIPGVSSTTSDQPPEVMYNRHQVQPSTVDLKIPELEDDSDQDQFADLDTFMTHHNTHHISE